MQDKSLEQVYLQFWEDVDNGSFKIIRKYGICSNFYQFIIDSGYHTKFFNHERKTFLEHYFKRWDKFSGDSAYPVPGGEHAYNSENVWDKSTEYGKLRWELFDFIKDECLKVLNKEEYCKDKGIYLYFTKHEGVNFTYSNKETASAYVWFLRGMFYSLTKEM